MELANLVKSNLKKEKSRVFTWELLLWEFHVKIYSDWHGLGYPPIPEQIDVDIGHLN